MSRISVALCTYNGAAYLREQLVSILGQTRPADELIVSDDGSSDGSAELARAVVEEAGTGIPFVLLRGEEPLGVTANFERAVRAAGSELIALSDQDDSWHVDRLETVAALFDADPGLTLVHTDAELVDADGAPLGVRLFAALEVSEAELAAERAGNAYGVFLRRNLATGTTVVFRREVLDAALPFPGEWVHDEWIAIVAAAVGRVGVLAEATVDYRQHGANQIGAVKPTLRYKVRRVLEPRGDRNELLARRFAVLAERLEALGDRVSARDLERARAKAAFEAARAALPRARFRRIGTVLRLWRSGDYREYASRGTLDVVRDLLQPQREARP